MVEMLRLCKWVLPFLWCMLGFAVQSVLLHLATFHYIWMDHRGGSTKELPDFGHRIITENKGISMTVLDACPVIFVSVFACSALYLKDLRLWVKVFVSMGLLFVAKGVLDYVTVLPDSIGWEHCQQRLTKNNTVPWVIERIQKLNGASSTDVLSEVFLIEANGVLSQTVGKIPGNPMGIPEGYPVRYCSDMILSGHTFAMLLPLLACCDLIRKLSRIHLSMETSYKVEWATHLLALALGFTELYLIISKRFHYTVDILLAAFASLLIYTNAALTLFINWFVEKGEDPSDPICTQDDGVIWIPGLCMPFCCFDGYYALHEVNVKHLHCARTFRPSAAPQQEKAFGPEETSPLLGEEANTDP